MKKLILTFTILLTIGAFCKIYSQSISYDEARLIAQKSFGEILSKDFKGVGINEDYYVKTINNQPVVYIFNENNGGFVIVSGEQKTVPVLGYSHDASALIDEDNWNPDFAYWMQTYFDQIDIIRTNNLIASPDAIEQRSKLVNGEDLGFRQTKDIAPLLSTTWNQGCGYNAQCPVDVAGPCGKVYTGCVATAMAQVIRYLQYPATGVGDKCYYHYVYGDQCADFSAATYNYSIMTNGSGNAEVAKLMYHCGVSVSMNYSPTGSGAYSNNVVTALENYFDYENVIIISKGSYSDANWNRILRNEIDNLRPFYYSGSGGSSGHAFVFDGYQGLDFFHINWGWGGSYNGYFYCSDLTPGSYSYNSSQTAVIGTIPAPLFTNLNVSSAVELSCATPLSQNLSTGNNYINYYKNTYPTAPGKELVYYFTTTLPGRIRVKINNVSEGGMNAFLLSHPHQDSLIVYGANGFIIDDTEPGTYWLAVESSIGAEPSFDIEVICPTLDAELIILSANVTPQYILPEQDNVNFNCQVKNIGNTTAAVNTINYYLSDDNIYDVGIDTYLGTDLVPELIPSAQLSISTILTMPAGFTSGSKNVVFVVDEADIVPEADEQNEFFRWITVPEPGLLDCSSSVSLTDGVWYYDNTQLNGQNNVENHWSGWEMTAPEIIHSFIAPYSGMATVSFTEKIAGEMKCMIYPVCNENTWLSSTWFANITDTLATTEFHVSAGTEYFIVVDSKLPIQGAYGVKVDLPAQCPVSVIEFWGETDLCDGDSYPSFWTQWGLPSYQWYKDGVALPGETNSSFTPTIQGSYFVEIIENGCAAQSDTIVINMSFPPDTAQIVSSGPTEFCLGGSVNLDLDNVVTYPLQWTFNGEVIPGETANTLIASESGTYALNTVNGSCSVESFNDIVVNVDPLPIDFGEQTPIPSDSVSFYYTFDENSYDIINNFSFSCWNFIPTDDRNGNFWQARDFTAEDIMGYSSNYDGIPSEFTLTYWFKTETTEGGVISSFVNSPWGPTSQDAVVYMSNNGKIHFWMSNGGTAAELSSVDSYNDGNWHSVLITHDLGILMEIDNDAEFLSIATPVTHASFNGYWTFAGPAIPATVSAMPTSMYFNGSLDDILCVNESKYILRDYLNDIPSLNISVIGDTVYCDLALVYFNIENSQNGIEYKVWNNTLSAWHPMSGIGTGADISVGGATINQTTEFLFYAVDPVTLCETLLDTSITISVYPTLSPVISITSDGTNPLCEGANVNFIATVTNAGVNPDIYWYFNDVDAGVNSANYTNIINSITDSVYALVVSNYVCPSPIADTSNIIGFDVLPYFTPSVTIYALPIGTVCSNTVVTFSSTLSECGSNPDYEWYLNTVHVGLNSPTYNHSGWTNGDEVYLVVIPDYECTTISTAVSTQITIDVSTPPEAAYTIISGGYCAGEDVCFEYSGETAGLDHVEWEIIDGGVHSNLTGIGPHCITPASSILDIIVSAYDVYGCSDTAWFFNPLLSGSITPSVTITSDQIDTDCQWGVVHYTAIPINCGLNPVYQWYLNGIPVGANSNIYITNNAANDDEIYVVVTNNISCATSPTAESNHIFADVFDVPQANMSVTGGNCENDEICLLYSGETAGVVSIEWNIYNVTQLDFVGVGPHCFIPATNNVQLVVTIYDSNGCSDSVANIIDISGVAPDITIFDTIYHCPEYPAVFDAPLGFATYHWSNELVTNHFSEYNDGLYYLTVTNGTGCFDIDSLMVMSYDDNGFEWPLDTTVCIDEILHLDTEYAYNSYDWYIGALYFTDSYVDISYTGINQLEVVLYVEDDNCFYADTMAIHFETCGFVNISELLNLKVYPNPAETEINFISDEVIDDLVIFNINGQIVYRSNHESDKIQIDITNWSAGEYYYRIITSSNKEIKSKFVKL